MSKFTSGKWIVRELFTTWGVFAMNEGKREPVADCLEEANARLIAAAPELHQLVMDELQGEAGGILSFVREQKIRAILDKIDGKEV